VRLVRRLLLSLLVAVAIAMAASAWYVRQWLETPLAIGNEPLIVEIQRGQSLTAVARDLAERGVLQHPRLLSLYASFIEADARIRAGEYAVQPGTSPKTLLQLFVSGAVVQHSITVVEGWPFRDLRKALAREELLEHTTRGKTDAEVMVLLGDPDRHPEGLFFPDTYLYGKGARDIDILRQAYERMRRELDDAWARRHDDLPLATPYEALILASIVERETALPAERARIAGVFTERLRRGMRLQTDPTVIYGLGDKFDGNLRRADLERDSPYNTYTRVGLPPTPIALPGAESLLAAVQPEQRGEIFFVATGKGDGSHEFTKTLAEHEAAVKRYLVRYRQQNSSTGR
jgi:UPF0755 protein